MLLGLAACSESFPNTGFCLDLTRGAGVCTKILTGEQFDIGPTEWADFSKRSVKISLDDAENLIIFAENHCQKKKCNVTKKTQRQIEKIRRQIFELKHSKGQ